MKHRNRARRITSGLALLLCAVLVSIVPAQVSAADWPQFQKDALNSGGTSDTGPSGGVCIGWKQYTAASQMNGIDTVPIVADGKVFVLSVAGKIHAFDALTGSGCWTRDLGSAAIFSFELASPCYAEGILYVAKQDGEVWALDGGTGATVWGPVQLGAVTDQLNTPLTYAEGKLYVGSAGGSRAYYCLNAADGAVLWSRASTSGKGYYWAGACAVGDYLIFGDDAGVLTCLGKDTGTLADEEDLKTIEPGAGAIRSSVSYSADTGRIYLTDQGGHCWAYGFDSATGELTYQWHVSIGWSTSTPAVHDGEVYVGQGGHDGPGALHCLNETDGASLWSFVLPNGGGVQSSPVLSIGGARTFIYFTGNCTNGAAYCLDENGNLIWEFVTDEAGGSGGHVLQGVALSSGRVYFGNDGGYLYALREPAPAWDVNGDGAVNYLDMIVVGNRYGETGTPGWIPEDVNDDGAVNYLDMIVIGNHYGE